MAPSADDAADSASSPGDAATGGAAVPAANAGQLQSRINVLEQELNESKRLLSVRDSEMQRLQQRIAELEKSGGVVADATLPSETADTTSEVAADAEPGAAEELSADTSVPDELLEMNRWWTSLEQRCPRKSLSPTEVGLPEESKAPRSLIPVLRAPIGLLGNMWLWVAVAGVLLLGFFVVRKRKSVPADSADDRWSLRRQEADEADDLQGFDDEPTHQDSIIVEESDFTATDNSVDSFAPKLIRRK